MAGQTLNTAATLSPGAMIVKRSSQRALQGFAAVVTLALLSIAFIDFTETPLAASS